MSYIGNRYQGRVEGGKPGDGRSISEGSRRDTNPALNRSITVQHASVDWKGGQSIRCMSCQGHTTRHQLFPATMSSYDMPLSFSKATLEPNSTCRSWTTLVHRTTRAGYLSSLSCSTGGAFMQHIDLAESWSITSHDGNLAPACTSGEKPLPTPTQHPNVTVIGSGVPSKRFPFRRPPRSKATLLQCAVMQPESSTSNWFELNLGCRKAGIYPRPNNLAHERTSSYRVSRANRGFKKTTD
jgi:hypothetical protein